jgi:hypothetical protein
MNPQALISLQVYLLSANILTSGHGAQPTQTVVKSPIIKPQTAMQNAMMLLR